MVSIDELDQRLIDLLHADGRLSIRNLAAQLGVSEPLARSRLRRLEDSQYLRIMTMVNQAALGFPLMAMVGISISKRPPADVAAELSKEPRISTIIVMQSSPELIVRIVVRSLKELKEVMTDVIAPVAGVERLFPSLATTVHKYDFRWAPIS
jgi:DNA-binding Lrp family transcriptional regulator